VGLNALFRAQGSFLLTLITKGTQILPTTTTTTTTTTTRTSHKSQLKCGGLMYWTKQKDRTGQLKAVGKSNLKHYMPIQLLYPESEIIFYPFQYTCMHIPHSHWRWILVPKQQQEYTTASIPSSHPSQHCDVHSTHGVHRRCQHPDRPCLVRCVPDHVVCVPDTLRTFSIATLCIWIHAVVLFITLVA